MEASRISIPVRRMKQFRLLERRPEILRSAMNGFKHCALAFDIDRTLLRTDRTEPQIRTTFSNRPILYQIVKNLENGTPCIVVSGADIQEQSRRLISPLSNYLVLQNKQSLLRNFHFFGNKGASRIRFKEDGKVDAAASEEYSRDLCIGSEALVELQNHFAGSKLLASFAWDGSGKQRVEKRKYSKGSGTILIDDITDSNPALKDLVLQLTVKSFPETGSMREDALAEVKKMIDGSAVLAGKYYAMKSGSTSIDIVRTGIDKSVPLARMLTELGWMRAAYDSPNIEFPIFYFGDEFSLNWGKAGEIYGNDNSVLQVPNVIAFAVNLDQSQIFSHPRLIPAGCGPEATVATLRYFSLLAGARSAMSLAESSTYKPVELPVIDTVEVGVPEVLQKADFKDTALVFRVNSLFMDPGALLFPHDVSSTSKEDHALVHIAHLLGKGVKVVLYTGDSANSQVKIVERIHGLMSKLGVPEKINNLTMYSNGGATKVMFDNRIFAASSKISDKYHEYFDPTTMALKADYASNDGIRRLLSQLNLNTSVVDIFGNKYDGEYCKRYQINGVVLKKIWDISNALLGEYQKKLEELALKGDKEAEQYLSELEHQKHLGSIDSMLDRQKKMIKWAMDSDLKDRIKEIMAMAKSAGIKGSLYDKLGDLAGSLEEFQLAITEMVSLGYDGVKNINAIDLLGRVGMDIKGRDSNAQFVVGPVMPQLRAWFMRRLSEEIGKLGADVTGGEQYTVSAGGSRTIDVVKSPAGRVAALEDFRKNNPDIKNFIYFGAEFFAKVEENGAVSRGNDMEALEVEGLTAFAMNQDQQEVANLWPGRIIPGGSGSQAVSAWLKYINEKLDPGTPQ